MKYIIIKLAIFILPFAVIIAYIEHDLRTYPNSYSKKMLSVNRQAQQLDLLILGSSHALNGIDPDHITGYSSYNMANASQSLYYDYAIYYILKGRLSKLKIVVLPISYFSLETLLVESTESWRVPFYEKYYGIPNEEARSRRIKALSLRKYSNILLYGFNESRNIFMNHASNPINDNITTKGWLPANVKKERIDCANGKKRVDYHHSRMKGKNLKLNIYYLENMISDMLQHNILPVVVTTPTYKTYLENIDQSRYQIMQDKLNSLCQKYGLNYYNHIADNNFCIGDFADHDHLNRNGAIKFSKLLTTDINISMFNFKKNNRLLPKRITR